MLILVKKTKIMTNHFNRLEAILNLDHQDFSHQRIEKGIFLDSKFTNLNLTDSDFLDTTLYECKFLNCNFTNCDFWGTYWAASQFKNCNFRKLYIFRNAVGSDYFCWVSFRKL